MAWLIGYIIVIIATPIITTIVGAVYYGWLGAFAGLGLGFLLMKGFGFIAKKRMQHIIGKSLKEREELTKRMEGSTISNISLKAVPYGKFLDGDEECAPYYTQHFELTFTLEPVGEESWSPEGVFLDIKWDDDVSDDEDDLHETGYGWYNSENMIIIDDEKTEIRKMDLTGKHDFYFRISVGEMIKDLDICYHEKNLQNVPLLVEEEPTESPRA